MSSGKPIIADLNHVEEWNYYRDQLPPNVRDIYSSPQYYSLWENEKIFTARCFIYTDGDQLALYPFLMQPIEDSFMLFHHEYFDIQGAYGYNGVFSNSSDSVFISNFFLSFDDYCHESSIIAEFTRYNPVLKNHTFHYKHEVQKANRNIIVDLTRDDIWMNLYEHSTRKNINKALRSGLEIVYFSGNQMDEKKYHQFCSLYFQTMQRNLADKEYYFEPEFFINTGRKLGPCAEFYFTIRNNEAIAAELVLKNDFCAYSFLGGTNHEFYPLRPNDLLKHGIINNLKRQGLSFYCIGGGKTENDGIYRFKKTFAKNGDVDFLIGKKIHNPDIYNYLIQQWERSHKEMNKSTGDFFLKYRIK